MGTWGTRTFDDDTASDWLDEIAEEPSVTFLRETLEVSDEGYLEFETCVGFLAAAEIVAGVLNGPREGLPEEAVAVIEALAGSDVEPLRKLAGDKARLVLGESSELRELWSENSDEFPVWRDGVLELCQRLDG